MNGLLLTITVVAAIPGAAAPQQGRVPVVPDTGFHRIEWYEVLAVAGGSGSK